MIKKESIQLFFLFSNLGFSASITTTFIFQDINHYSFSSVAAHVCVPLVVENWMFSFAHQISPPDSKNLDKNPCHCFDKRRWNVRCSRLLPFWLVADFIWTKKKSLSFVGDVKWSLGNPVYLSLLKTQNLTKRKTEWHFFFVYPRLNFLFLI